VFLGIAIISLAVTLALLRTAYEATL